jgi:hypothetical protein
MAWEKLFYLCLSGIGHHFTERTFSRPVQNLMITGKIGVVGKVRVGGCVLLEGGTYLLDIKNGSINIGNHIFMTQAVISSTTRVELVNDVVMSAHSLIIDHDGYE